MQLYHSPHSPFSLKVAIHAHVLGLADRIEILKGSGNPLVIDPAFRRLNPSGQIPVLRIDTGEALFDSKVICGYLSALAGADVSSPAQFLERRDEALGDTMAEAALAYRYEAAVRPEALRWPEWQEAWRTKIMTACVLLEERAAGFGAREDIGVIAIYCALKFISQRIPELQWTANAPRLAHWYEGFATRPVVLAATIAA